jgi:ABC-2 type transport system permease protein
VVKYICITNLKILLRTVHDKLIDLFIWVVSMVAVNVYLLPKFGIDPRYGAFMIASLAASAGLFEQYSSATQLVSDFEGNRVFAFYLTLPLASWLVPIAYILFYFANTLILSIGVLPLCKILFWNHFSLAHFNIYKYSIMLVLTSLFYATFTLWLAGKVPNLERIGGAWMRFVYPLWFFGGFQYSYRVLEQINPKLAYFSLINPLLYIMEGTRAAVLGQEEYLNFWLCAGMTMFFSFICAIWATFMLKKRLDFV